VVVLGVLVLMALLATSFSTLQTLERRVTHNYTDQVRAKLVAQSGIDSAIARLRSNVRRGWRGARDWVYYGNVADETLEPDVDGPLEAALNPSFAWEADSPADPGNPSMQNPENGTTAPHTIRIEGEPRGLSGFTGGTYGLHGDIYSLKVTDCQSQINVNDGVSWGPGHSVSANLRRILNALGDQPSVGISGLGDRILSARPPGGFAGKEELRRAVGNDDALFAKFRDLVTLHSWKNKVHNPVPLSEDPGVLAAYAVRFDRPVDPQAKAIYRAGHPLDATGNDFRGTWPLRFYDPAIPENRLSTPSYCAVYGSDSLNPQWIESVDRSPVNVNTATREVLTALIVDLEGFFVSDRRKPEPVDIFYRWLYHAYVYRPEKNAILENGCGALGFLYRTKPYGGPGSRMGTGVGVSAISSERIAQEIIACRRKEPSPNTPGLNYATEPCGGPFRTWAQFNLFVDRLVESGVIADDRPIYFDYAPVWTQGFFTDVVYDVRLVPSAVQSRGASTAAGDVLKANFNPNLHLNELNPDRNLYMRVDKTDLIVHSTEFCFLPMGRFEIESVGRVLWPQGGVDALTAPDNREVARSRVSAVVQLYEPGTQSTQAELYRGSFAARATAPTTNNGRAVETGPEPDNGPAPLECRWDGWVQLSSMGGPVSDMAWTKPKGELRTSHSQSGVYGGAVLSSIGSSESGSDFHSHFAWDHVAHHHTGGASRCLPIGHQADQSGPTSLNFRDPCEESMGDPSLPRSPYSPVQDAGGRYRLCRSFEISPGGGAPPGFRYPPSDLRVDGAYADLHSAFGYDLKSVPFSTCGTIAMWVKPNWFPEATGRMRTFVSMRASSKLTAAVAAGFGPMFYPLHFDLTFLPSYHSFEEPFRPLYGGTGRQCSLIMALAADQSMLSVGGGISLMSPRLNHEFEPDFGVSTEDYNRFTGSAHGGKNHLRGHEWAHVVLQMRAGAGFGNQNSEYTGAGNGKRITLLVNGRELPGTDQLTVHADDAPKSYDGSVGGGGIGTASNLLGFSMRFGGEYSGIGSIGGKRCYPADSTLDEIHYWSKDAAKIYDARDQFLRGRYYRPSDSDPADARFVSAPLQVPCGSRRLAPAAQVSPPPSDLETGLQPPPPASERRVQVLGVSWTALAEDHVPDGAGGYEPRMWNYQPLISEGAPLPLVPARAPDPNGCSFPTVAQLWVVVEGPNGRREYGPYHDEGWSAVLDPAQERPIELDVENEQVRFEAKLRVGPTNLNTVLLATPILDDVVIFVGSGRAKIISYSEQRN
jgi:hypothetical protein